jgi:hypothetical protein
MMMMRVVHHRYLRLMTSRVIDLVVADECG